MILHSLAPYLPVESLRVQDGGWRAEGNIDTSAHLPSLSPFHPSLLLPLLSLSVEGVVLFLKQGLRM